LCEMVVRRGNAPRSSAYQPGALLLSYRTMARRAVARPREKGCARLRAPRYGAAPFARSGIAGEGWRMVQELHPRSPEAHSVFGTGGLLLCQPSEIPWQEDVLPLNHSHENKRSRERSHTPGTVPFQQRTNTSW